MCGHAPNTKHKPLIRNLKRVQVRLAITGEAFMEAGRGVSDLLKRNFLDAYGVWWFPPMVGVDRVWIGKCGVEV